MTTAGRRAAIAFGACLTAHAAQAQTPEPRSPALTVIHVNPQPGVDCPSAAEVTKAIDDRVPGAVSATIPNSGGAAARLVLTPVGPGAIHVELVSATGASVLERTLEAVTAPAPRHGEAAGGGAACLALADTISLIVQRYFRHLEYRDEPPLPTVAPRPPPPAPSAPAAISVLAPAAPERPRTLLVGVTTDMAGPFTQPGGDTIWTPSVGLAVAVEWRHWTLAAQGAVGASVRSRLIPNSDSGRFSYLPVPLRLAIGFRLPFARGFFSPTAAAGADLLFETERGLRGGGPSLTAEPIVEAGARWTLRLGPRAFIEAHAFGALDLQPHDFQITGLPGPVLQTARWYGRGGLSLGVAYDLGGAQLVQ